MNTTTRRPIRPTTPADLWRLAEEARSKGVVLLAESATGERFATSASDPRIVHRLTERGCSCKGFAYAGRCTHHSLLLDELGWLPDAAPAPVCVTCRGSGLDPECAGHTHAGRTILCPCPTCGSTGVGAVDVVILERPAA